MGAAVRIEFVEWISGDLMFVDESAAVLPAEGTAVVVDGDVRYRVVRATLHVRTSASASYGRSVEETRGRVALERS